MSEHHYRSGDEQSANNEANIMMPILVLVGVTTVILLLLLSSRTVVEAPEVAAAPEAAAVDEDTDTLSETSEEVVEEAVEGVATGGVYSAEDVATGQSTFVASCSGCHGSNAQGVPGLGKNLVESEFVRGMSDLELHEFIVVGRTAWDPANTTGIAMPPRGGNPALNDESIDQIIAYIRTLANPELLIPAGGTAADVAEDPTEADSVAEDSAADGTGTDGTGAEAPDTTTDATTDTGGTDAETTTQPMVVPETVHEFSAAEDYALSCAGCHGVDGQGVDEWPALVGSDVLNDADALLDLITPKGFTEPSENFVHPTLLEWPLRTPEQQQAIVDYIISLGGE